MRALLQRVSEASVLIDGRVHAAIGPGLLVLLGVESSDGPEDILWLAGKITRLRIFPDAAGVMNRSVAECQGDILVISQFTLHASTRKGNRPSYSRAAPPDLAQPVYEAFLTELARQSPRPLQRGVFGADMKVALTNDGPVTLLIDSRLRE